MRKTTVILFFLIAALQCMGQRDFSTGWVFVGIKGGVNLPTMHYTDKWLSELPQIMKPKPIVGVFVDIPLNSFITFSPELLYVERGMNTIYTHYSSYEIQYSIKARYVDARLPFHFGSNVTKSIQPYVVTGVDIGYLLGGNIHLIQPEMPLPELEVKIGNANMNRLYVGAFAGLGVKLFRIVKGQKIHLRIEAAYNMGFVDSFSKMEHDEDAHSVNVNAYNITGKRFPRGLEATVGFTFPIYPDMNDACYGFSKNKWK